MAEEAHNDPLQYLDYKLRSHKFEMGPGRERLVMVSALPICMQM